MPKTRKQRLNPEDRRQLLLQAALDALSQFGAQGTGVREISKTAGVSPGLITHYFDGKESLFVEAYEEMSQRYLAEIRAISCDKELAAETRLKNVFRQYFSGEWSKDGMIGTYTSFWSLSQTIPALKTAFGKVFQEQCLAFEQLVDDLAEERGLTINPKQFATFLLIFLEGVWFESCLNPKAIDKDSIQEFCWDWLECYIAAKSCGSP